MELQKAKHNQLPSNGRFGSLFDHFFNNDYFGLTNYEGGKRYNMPAVNVSENDSEYKLEVAAPGLKKKDFNIELEEGKLVISSEVRNEVQEEKENFKRKEFSYQSFSRSFILPEDVNEDDIKANYEDGVLRISIPKAEPATPKKKLIEIG